MGNEELKPGSEELKGRCGKQFQEPPSMMQANLPLYLIFIKEAMPYRLRGVDLCDDCTKDFEKWMKGGKK